MDLFKISRKHDIQILARIMERSCSVNDIVNGLGISRRTVDNTMKFWRNEKAIIKDIGTDLWKVNPDHPAVIGLRTMSNTKYVPKEVPKKPAENGVYVPYHEDNDPSRNKGNVTVISL